MQPHRTGFSNRMHVPENASQALHDNDADGICLACDVLHERRFK
jgi:hypothetical protein